MKMHNRFRVLTGLISGGVIGVGLLIAAGTALSAILAVVIARRVVTPPGRDKNILRVLAVGESTIVLSAHDSSRAPGRFSLWFANDTGYAQMGEVVAQGEDWVARELLAVVTGTPVRGDNARTKAWFYLTPADLDLGFVDVVVATELGPAPAWLIPAQNPNDLWAIHVHGRGVQRPETVRALREFYDAGITSLAVSYRNDTEAPNSADNRYGLGSTEYRDVHSALEYAQSHGARRVILMGWSMGAATVLQTLMRSELRDMIVGLVLESPVIAWGPTLELHGTLNRIPPPIQRAAQLVLASEQSGLLTGVAGPIDLPSMNFVERASELDRPILLLHSEADAYVPVQPSRELAELRPDIVTYVEFSDAGHTRLWNHDSDRWLGAIRSWLKTHGFTNPG